MVPDVRDVLPPPKVAFTGFNAPYQQERGPRRKEYSPERGLGKKQEEKDDDDENVSEAIDDIFGEYGRRTRRGRTPLKLRMKVSPLAPGEIPEETASLSDMSKERGVKASSSVDVDVASSPATHQEKSSLKDIWLKLRTGKDDF